MMSLPNCTTELEIIKWMYNKFNVKKPFFSVYVLIKSTDSGKLPKNQTVSRKPCLQLLKNHKIAFVRQIT